MTDAPEKTPHATLADDLSWWWSTDEERYYGPCATRADAILDAFAEGEAGRIHLMQATQDEPHFELWDGEQLAERFDELNEEHCDPDGDPMSTQVPAEEWNSLAARLTAMTRATIRRKGILRWVFGRTQGGEWVDLNRARRAALPEEVLDLLDEIAIGFDPEMGWAESYLDEQIARLKRIARRTVEATQ